MRNFSIQPKYSSIQNIYSKDKNQTKKLKKKSFILTIMKLNITFVNSLMEQRMYKKMNNKHFRGNF